MKKWVTYDKDYSNLNILMDELNISEIMARVLINRGIDTVDKARIFLSSDINLLHNPFRMKDIDKAVNRIIQAIEENQKICIYGDYDVDGITSVAILHNYLAIQKVDVIYYIPSRLEEGYGLNSEAINKILKEKVDLIITVDCGISSIAEAELCNEAGVDIIITDHHKCGEALPNAYAVINPNQTDCPYPFKYLAGGGVALKLVHALASVLGAEDNYLDFIDLAALATVADIVPLLGENRLIVKKGLELIRQSKNIGINALIDVINIKPREINTYHLGYLLAPRLNAAGRIKDANIAVELLITKDYTRAFEIAKELNESNIRRQKIEASIADSAIKAIEKDIDVNSEKIIVVSGTSWHPGVIGIVASRITEKYNLPSIVLSVDEGLGKGSARSLPGFNIYEAISNCKDLLDKFGGHEQAAGLTLKEENIESLKLKIGNIAKEMMEGEILYKKIYVDYKIDKSNNLHDILNEIEFLEPFGLKNPKPLFVYRNMKIVDLRRVGNGKHLTMTLNDGEKSIKGIGFNFGYAVNHIAVNQKIDIICSVERNVWKGKESIQLHIKDIRLSRRSSLDD